MKISNSRLQRMLSGMKLKDLAYLISVTPSYLSKIERGIAKPSAMLRIKIADAIHVKECDLP